MMNEPSREKKTAAVDSTAITRETSRHRLRMLKTSCSVDDSVELDVVRMARFLLFPSLS